MSELINVFVSYSWAVEKDTKIVEELDRLCQQRGIKLIRDNNALKHGKSIKTFMDNLSKGDHVITVFSKPYFESKWCMYELLRIYQRGDFEQRTHPVIADECDLQDEDFRLQVVDFWNKQFETFRDKLNGRDPLAVKTEYDQLELYRDLYQQINKIVNFARDRLTTPLAELQKQNFTQLLDSISPLKGPGDASSQISDEDYLQEIRRSLEADFKKSEPFREHVIQICDREFGDAQKLHDYLIEQCVAGQFVEVIQNLQSALVDSYESINENDISALNKLYGAAEDAVSKLVVFRMDDAISQRL